MMFKNIDEIYSSNPCIRKVRDDIEILDLPEFRKESVDDLIFNAVFNESNEVKAETRWIIKCAAWLSGIRLASIHSLYEAVGRGEEKGFAVPAINIRGMTYDVARAVFRAAMKDDVGAFILEIAKSEIGYTNQSPSEYAVSVMAAALKEGFSGPLFIQGDHFQLNVKAYETDPQNEVSSLKRLIKRAVNSGFCNIDIDASTLVDLKKPDIREQQKPNFEVTAELTEYIRDIEHQGNTVSVGGEIGEVGGKNSTEDDLRAFMDGYLDRLKRGIKGISKISVQTGTAHGGVVLPDGSIARVKVDFDTIERLSRLAREHYGLAGVVQHGASTLPNDAFDMFVKKEAAEVHLATGFQNMIYESRHFPVEFKNEIYRYILENLHNERKEGQTDEQFIYKTRKKGFGPFKRRFWEMPQDTKSAISSQLEERFSYLFKKLNVINTKEVVARWIEPARISFTVESEMENL